VLVLVSFGPEHRQEPDAGDHEEITAQQDESVEGHNGDEALRYRYQKSVNWNRIQ
jgi:hypothetical protein